MAVPEPTTAARRRRALELAAAGRTGDSLALCRAELAHTDDGAAWLADAIVGAMQRPDLGLAGELAAIHAVIQRGYPAASGAPAIAGDAWITLPTLRHDLAQLCYLCTTGVLDASDAGTGALIDAYAGAVARYAHLGPDDRVPLAAVDRETIGASYGRLVHVADAPRLAHALAPGWDRARAQRAYLDERPGVVVIDDFLAPDALAAVRRFCLESTVWSGNRYASGRLGSLLFAGFNAPLLLQIAEEIRDAFPDVIGTRHPLRQLWGFKYTGVLPGDSTLHADFAAVNVNFWIAPTEANLDPDSGGMVIYDVDAPPAWDFTTYNERSDVIRAYLDRTGARAIRVPYRANRAVIFNSDLFHATEAVRFRPAYEHHRVNITMLYGERRFDDHHPPREDAVTGAWRSAAFTRRRR